MDKPIHLTPSRQFTNIQASNNLQQIISVETGSIYFDLSSSLLKEVIANIESINLPVFLETSTLQNLPWYRRFGFQVYDELTLTYIMYFLKRDLSK